MICLLGVPVVGGFVVANRLLLLGSCLGEERFLEGNGALVSVCVWGLIVLFPCLVTILLVNLTIPVTFLGLPVRTGSLAVLAVRIAKGSLVGFPDGLRLGLVVRPFVALSVGRFAGALALLGRHFL